MITQLMFRLMPDAKKVNYLQTKAVSLGNRPKDGRTVYVYMVRNLFVEVLYVNDNPTEAAEKIHVLHGLKNLNAYLEQDFKTTF